MSTQASSSSLGNRGASAFTDEQQPRKAGSYRLTHPKNYVGVPLALASDSPVEFLIDEYLVSMPGAAKLGARALGYLTANDTLTPAGHRLVEIAREQYGSLQAALTHLASDACTYSRFTDSSPQLARAARQPLADHPAVASVVEVLDDGARALPAFAVAFADSAPETATSVLLHDTANVQAALAESTVDEPASLLATIDPYRTEGTYQFKNILCHLGILTTPGADSSSLTPTEDRWELAEQATEVQRQ
jgi:hypothetical protein